MYEAEFVWTEPASTVIVTGTFDNWSQSVRCVKGPAGFAAKVSIPYGQKTDYKFVVDGRWRVNPTFPTNWDYSGNQNNFIMAPSEPPPSVLALKPVAESIKSATPEPVTPVNRSTAPTAPVTPMSVPESSVAPHPGLTLDSSMARSIVQSFLDVVHPTTEKPAVPDKTNEPAAPIKDLATATAPAPPVAAVEEKLGPLFAVAQEQVSKGISALNGAVSPHLNAPHANEPAPVTKSDKNLEPGYPIWDLASLTGPAPVVVAAQDSLTPIVNGAQEKISSAVTAIGEKASPAIASVQETVAPIVSAVQERAAPVITALQGAATAAVATITDTPTAQPTEKDALALPSEPTAEVHKPTYDGTGPEKAKADDLSATAMQSEALIVSTKLIPAAPVDLSPTPVDPIPPVVCVTGPPGGLNPAIAPNALPIPRAPSSTAVLPVNGAGSGPTTPGENRGTLSASSSYSKNTGSPPTTPTKPTHHKRHSSFGKLFPGRKTSSSDMEESAGKSPSKKTDSVRSKKTSIITKIKNAFHHDHAHPTSNGSGAGQS